ncbi:MAG: hypothetical protein CMH55_08005 [Myxococcales bacterium]|nr:hypothetical protein [Myxococcales bacterium]
MISAHHRTGILAGVMGAALFSACSHLPSPLEPEPCASPAACVQEDLEALAQARLKGDHRAWVEASVRAYRRTPDLTLPLIYSLTPNDQDLGEEDLRTLTRALLGRISDRAAGHQARRMIRGTFKSRFNQDLPDLSTGLIGEWMLVAGFDAPRGAALTRVDPPQEGFDPKATVATHRGPRPWRKVHRAANRSPLVLKHWTHPTRNQCGHLVTRIRNAAPIQLQARSSSEFRLWVDGSPFAEIRGLDSSLTLETTLPGTLAPGTHQLEVRSCSQSSNWWLDLRAVDGSGRATTIELLSPLPRSEALSSEFTTLDLDGLTLGLAPADWPESLRQLVGANLLYRVGRPMAAFQALGARKDGPGLLIQRSIAVGARRQEQRLQAAEMLAQLHGAPLEYIDTLLSLNQGDRAAKKLFRSPELMARTDPRALRVIARTLDNFGTSLRRLRLWQKAEKIHPDWLTPLLEQASILKATRTNEADKLRLRAEAMAPYHGRFQRRLRRSMRRGEGNLAQNLALLAFDRRYSPLSLSLQMQEVNLLNKAGHRQKARAMAARVRHQNPYAEGPQRWWAKEDWLDGGMAKAMPELEKLLVLNPSASMALQAKRFLELQGGEQLEIPLWARPTEEALLALVADREKYRPPVPASQVMLMDDHLELIEKDGSRRQVITVVRWFLDRRTAQRYLNTKVRGSRLQIHHAFLVKADGTRVDPASRRGGAIRFREIDDGACLVLQYEKVISASSIIRGLVNGTFWFEAVDTWNVQPTFTIATRQDRPPNFHRIGDALEETTAQKGDLKVWRFARKGVAPPPTERPVMAPWREQSQVRFSTMEKWDPYVNWVRDLLREGNRVTPTLEATAQTLTKDAATVAEKVDRIYAYASHEIQYEQDYARVIEGWEPHLPDQVVDRKYGDCKDKSMLIIVLLRSLGIQAEPVLVRTWSLGEVDTKLPSSQFNHMIAWLPAQEGIPTGRFLDATAEYLDLDNLRHDVQGTLGLVVTPDAWRFQRIPERPAQQEYMRGNLIHLGGQRWEVKLESRGHAASTLRRAGKGERQAKTFEAIAASSLWPGAEVESAQMVENEADRLELRMVIKVPDQVLNASGRLALPIIAIDGWKRLFSRPTRHYPLMVAGFRWLRLELSSQAGSLQLTGEPISVAGPSYQGQFRCDEGRCVLEEQINRVVVPPADYTELARHHSAFRQAMVQGELRLQAQP